MCERAQLTPKGTIGFLAAYLAVLAGAYVVGVIV